MYLLNEGFSLKIPFIYLETMSEFPKEIPPCFGNIKDNADLAVFMAEYSNLNVLKKYVRNSRPSFTEAW